MKNNQPRFKGKPGGRPFGRKGSQTGGEHTQRPPLREGRPLSHWSRQYRQSCSRRGYEVPDYYTHGRPWTKEPEKKLINYYCLKCLIAETCLHNSLNRAEAPLFHFTLACSYAARKSSRRQHFGQAVPGLPGHLADGAWWARSRTFAWRDKERGGHIPLWR